MSEYVAIICKNCGKTQLYTTDNYKKMTSLRCDSCGNGRLPNSIVDYTRAMRRDFEYIGLDNFLKEGLLDYYGDMIGKSANKGFEVVKLKTDIN